MGTAFLQLGKAFFCPAAIALCQGYLLGIRLGLPIGQGIQMVGKGSLQGIVFFQFLFGLLQPGLQIRQLCQGLLQLLPLLHCLGQ